MLSIAHVDCDAFYASCEAVRHPELKGRPICVLSSQNAIVVAKSYDAKALGVTTGMPVWEAKKLVPQAAFLAADFRYYGQLSDKVFSILRRYSPDIEIYSIDEAFLDLSGIRRLWQKSFQQLADEMRLAIVRETGITASVGIANTRALAKLASEANKPNAVMVLPAKEVDPFLHGLPVVAIPGIGRNRAALLQEFNIQTALQFRDVEEGGMHRLLGRHGLLVKHELSGRAVLPLQLKPVLPKSIAKTASMGMVSAEYQMIAAHLSYHAMRLVSELVAKHLLTRRLCLFLTLASFEQRATYIQFGFPTSSLKRMTAAVKAGLLELFRVGDAYRGCGVVATDISREGSSTPDLFGFMQEDRHQTELMLTVNRIDKKYGNHTVSLAAVRKLKQKKAAAFPLSAICRKVSL